MLGLLTVAYYFGVFAMAWDLLFGFAGEVNFGPTFLIGLGAYTAGILDNQSRPRRSGSASSPARSRPSSAASLLALPALRLRGPYFGLTTLVAVLMLQNFIVVFAGLTGGEIGLTVPDVISIDADVNYWIALGFMAVSGAILFGLSRSPVGLILQASGQDAGAGRRARLQRRQAQARGLHRQRVLLRPRRRAAGLLHGHGLGRHLSSTSRSACRSSSRRCSAAGAPSSARRSARSS